MMKQIKHNDQRHRTKLNTELADYYVSIYIYINKKSVDLLQTKFSSLSDSEPAGTFQHFGLHQRAIVLVLSISSVILMQWQMNQFFTCCGSSDPTDCSREQNKDCRQSWAVNLWESICSDVK